MNWAWIADIGQIIFADIILSGDNALVIGMAAAGLSPQLRKRAIFIGMAMAAFM
ncbi:MAG: TerC family protein, partial [Candidatus Puniceispirillaceae bacterium]